MKITSTIQRARFTLLLCSLLLMWLVLPAQKYSNEFLSIGVGAKAQGMGNAVIASLEDVYAGVWNPAGLAALRPEQGLQIAAMHSEWFGGVGNFDYIGISLPTSQPGRRLGLSLVRFGIDQIPNTLSLYESDGTINFDNLKEFSAADYAFIGSYAQALDRPAGPLRLGGNVKVVHRRIGPFATSWGFGLDLGAQMARGRWHFGFLAKDITTTFNAWTFSFSEEDKQTLSLTGNEIPINSVEITKPQLILGVARSFSFAQGNVSIRPELDIIVSTDGQRNTWLSSDPFSIDPVLGVETGYKDFLFLRLGANQLQRERDFGQIENWSVRPSLGLGLRLGSLLVDYAYTDLGDDRNTFSHVVSLRLELKPRNRS